jgi:hypothetical protein
MSKIPLVPRTIPIITMRELRANLASVVKAQTPRILGDRHKARCLIVPIPPSEWHRKLGMDKRMKETRKHVEKILEHLEN